jgi:nucleoid DNA-binding protein
MRKNALAALDAVLLERLGDAERVKIGGLVQLTVRVKPARKAREGRNPATGEEAWTRIPMRCTDKVRPPVRLKMTSAVFSSNKQLQLLGSGSGGRSNAARPRVSVGGTARGCLTLANNG